MKTIENLFKLKRYSLPEHWILEPDSFFGMEYTGYRQIVLDMMKDTHSLDCIDIGCGDGRMCYDLVNLGHNVVGIDYSIRALEYARCFVPKAEFYECDLTKETFPFKDRLFDVALMVEVIEHVEPKYHKRILSDIKDRLKKNGFLIITVPSKRLPQDKRKHYKHFSLEEIRSLLDEAGFETIVVVGNHKVPLMHQILTYLFSNPLYDIRIFRRFYAKIYRRYFINSPIEKAGRYILKCKINTPG